MVPHNIADTCRHTAVCRAYASVHECSQPHGAHWGRLRKTYAGIFCIQNMLSFCVLPHMERCAVGCSANAAIFFRCSVCSDTFVYTWYHTFCLRVTWGETKLQNLGCGRRPAAVSVNGSLFEPVDMFIYLGSLQSSGGYCWKCRLGLIASALSSLHHIWNNKCLSIPTKIRHFQA